MRLDQTLGSENNDNPLERFADNEKCIHMLDSFLTRFRRIAYVNLYKQGNVRNVAPWDEEGWEDMDMIEKNTVLMGYDPDLENDQITPKDILAKEDIYYRIYKIREKAREFPEFALFIEELYVVLMKLVKEGDYRSLEDLGGKWEKYVEEINSRPDYEQRRTLRVNNFLRLEDIVWERIGGYKRPVSNAEIEEVRLQVMVELGLTNDEVAGGSEF